MALVEIPTNVADRLAELGSPVAEVLVHELRLQQVADALGLDIAGLLTVLEQAARPSGLTAGESDALAQAGIDLAGPADDPGGVRAVLAGLGQSHALITEGLTVEQAAAELGVTPARVRQRIADGDIGTIRRPEGHLLPRWQLVDGRLVPGLSIACPAEVGLHPVTVARFMTRPNTDLDIDGEQVSPRDWLILGGDPAAVGALVETLARG